MKKNTILATLLFITCVVMVVTCRKDNVSENTGGAGSNAHDILSADTYSTLAIEIDYMTGFKPADASINNLKNFLSAHINKPAGINVFLKEIATQSGRALSLSDISQIESGNRTTNTTGSTIAAYIIFTDGTYSGNSGNSQVVGVAYKSTSIVIFGKTVHSASGGIGQVGRVELESTALEHEFSHLLGLVNAGTPMQTNHIDVSHGKHCINSNCLMYHTAETTDITGSIAAGNIPVLDNACINDLKGNGGK